MCMKSIPYATCKGEINFDCVHIVQMTNYNIGSGSRRKTKKLQETLRTVSVVPGTTQIAATYVST